MNLKATLSNFANAPKKQKTTVTFIHIYVCLTSVHNCPNTSHINCTQINGSLWKTYATYLPEIRIYMDLPRCTMITFYK